MKWIIQSTYRFSLISKYLSTKSLLQSSAFTFPYILSTRQMAFHSSNQMRYHMDKSVTYGKYKPFPDCVDHSNIFPKFLCCFVVVQYFKALFRQQLSVSSFQKTYPKPKWVYDNLKHLAGSFCLKWAELHRPNWNNSTQCGSPNPHWTAL